MTVPRFQIDLILEKVDTKRNGLVYTNNRQMQQP
jgi:hypothetical protein